MLFCCPLSELFKAELRLDKNDSSVSNKHLDTLVNLLFYVTLIEINQYKV